MNMDNSRRSWRVVLADGKETVVSAARVVVSDGGSLLFINERGGNPARIIAPNKWTDCVELVRGEDRR
jgi:hypothetical protein